MDLELVLVVALLAAATAPLVLLAWRRGTRPVAAAATLAWLCAAGAVALGGRDLPRPDVERRTRDVRPLEVAHDGYVRSDACASCHPREYGTWYASYHRTMTQPATPESVKAPWEGEHDVRGDRYVLERRGDEFWVEMTDPDAAPGTSPRVWKQVVQVTGSHHWQFFWYASGKTRVVHILLLAYRLVDDPRWMPLDGCCMSPPHSGQETGSARWSRVCNKCHATHAKPRVTDLETADTHVAELGIACEACHGPGGEHVAANRDPRRRYALHASGEDDPTIVNPADLDVTRASHVGGHCHGVTGFRTHEDRERWREEGWLFRPGELLTDSRELLLNTGEAKYWPDGEIRVSGREYMGLHLSPCFEAGEMSCLSCHEMHPKADDPRPLEEWRVDQLARGMRGDRACTQCHEEYASEEAVAAHTRHRPGSSGASCYSCHMPYTVYGLLKSIRTHRVKSPSVAESVELGRPNACNLCHLDRTLAWTAGHLEEWYGQPRPALLPDQRAVAASLLWALEGDAAQRALVMAAFGREEARDTSGTRWMSPFLAFLLNDPYSSVRYLAHRAALLQEETSALENFDFLADHRTMEAQSKAFYRAWMERTAERNFQRGPELLIGEDGQPLLDEVQRRLSRRDDRDITLNE